MVSISTDEDCSNYNIDKSIYTSTMCHWTNTTQQTPPTHRENNGKIENKYWIPQTLRSCLALRIEKISEKMAKNIEMKTIGESLEHSLSGNKNENFSVLLLFFS